MLVCHVWLSRFGLDSLRSIGEFIIDRSFFLCKVDETQDLPMWLMYDTPIASFAIAEDQLVNLVEVLEAVQEKYGR